MRARLLLPLLALAALVLTSLPAAAGSARTMDTSAACRAKAARSARLAADADRIELVLAAGRPATRYSTRYVATADGATRRANGGADSGSVVLVHAGGPHGLTSAYGPTEGSWLYFADIAILHWVSGGDCTGPDSFAYAVTVGCMWADTGNPTLCLYDAWVGLQTSVGTANGPWTANWGYSHRKNASARQSCYAQGGQHALPDNYGWVRTWVYLDGSYTAPSPDLPMDARKTTSNEMITGAAHTMLHGPCWPAWCQSSGPPTNDPFTAFNSCALG
jgi:hypothetical protein